MKTTLLCIKMLVFKKLKVSLEDSALSLSEAEKSVYNLGSHYYNNLINLQKSHKFDSIVTVSALSVNNLKKFARNNEVKDMQIFVVPEGANSIAAKNYNFPYSLVRSSSLITPLADINQLAIIANLSDNFEMMIESRKIRIIKGEQKTKERIISLSMMSFGVCFFVLLSFVNIHMLNLTLFRTK